MFLYIEYIKSKENQRNQIKWNYQVINLYQRGPIFKILQNDRNHELKQISDLTQLVFHLFLNLRKIKL